MTPLRSALVRASQSWVAVLVVQAQTSRLALLVDEVCGVVECAMWPPDERTEDARAGWTVLKLGEDLLLVPDLDRIPSGADAK